MEEREVPKTLLVLVLDEKRKQVASVMEWAKDYRD